MKKLFKYISIPLAALLLASCEAKNPIISNDEFKNNVLNKVEEHRLGSDFKGKTLSYKKMERNVDTLKFTSLEYQVDTSKYGKLIEKPEPGKSVSIEGLELSVSTTVVDNGKIAYDEESGYTESGKGTTKKCTLSLKDPDATDGVKQLQFAYVTQNGTETETVYSGVDFDASTGATDEEKAFIDSFFTRDATLEIYNPLKGLYNGYIDEMKTSLDDANSQKEIVAGKTNYIYRYLDAAGYHEFQISNTEFSIDRVGFRADLEVQQATNVALSGF